MNKEIDELLELQIITGVNNPEKLKPGSVVRRTCGLKDQQGQFTGLDDMNGIILVNVVDLSSPGFLTEAGIVRPGMDDRLYSYTTVFDRNIRSAEALDILYNWPLYRKNADIQSPMQSFFKSSYSPDYLLYLKKNDRLDAVFVPIQQKLKIGRYLEVINWDFLRREKFTYHLNELKPGEHITYIALVPPSSSYAPKFYSIGTKPHEETQISLRTEGFNFKPTHGGHIKAEKRETGIVYYVDAGSNFIGKDTRTKLETAEAIVKALKREYKEHTFIPLEGRGAFGTEQSY